MPVSQNTALFSLLGTYYGGDGRSTFGLPNLQGNVPMGVGQGPGLSDRFIGEESGVSSITLISSEMPAHTHVVRGGPDIADLSAPGPTRILARSAGANLYQSAAANLTAMSAQTLSITGGSQPHNNMQPYLVLNFCIALQGVYPQRP